MSTHIKDTDGGTAAGPLNDARCVCDATFPQGDAITARQTHHQIPLDQLLWS